MKQSKQCRCESKSKQHEASRGVILKENPQIQVATTEFAETDAKTDCRSRKSKVANHKSQIAIQRELQNRNQVAKYQRSRDF